MSATGIYVAAMLFAITVELAVAAWMWSEDASRARRLFVLWIGLHVMIGGLLVGTVLAPGSSLAVAFTLVRNAVSTAIPIASFLFALEYTGRSRGLSQRSYGLLGGWYLALVALVLTDPFVGLAFAEYESVAGPVGYLAPVPTPLYAALSFPLFLLAVAGPALLGAKALSDTGLTRTQTLALFVGFMLPFVAPFAWMNGLVPGPLDGAFVLTGAGTAVLVADAVHRYHLFDVVPLAREMVFDELDDAVIVVDRDRRLLDYNRRAVDVLPSLEGGTGEPIDRLADELAVEPDADGLFPDSFTAVSDGEPRTYSVSAASLPSASAPRGFGLVVRDVTDRQRRVRDLERQTEQLERFASMLSHDVRNPLNVLQANLDLAVEEGETASVERSRRAIDRIGQIVDDLVALARTGKTIDERSPVALATVARNAWSTTDTAAATLEVDVDDSLVVYADETRLRNVFENLFRNAVEHGPEAPTVRVGAHADGFHVEDDGPGIPPDRRGEVFEYEYTTADGGSGVGLAIVDSIARAHGWSVEVTDGDAGGARFVFSTVDLVSEPPVTERSPTDGDGSGTHDDPATDGDGPPTDAGRSSAEGDRPTDDERSTDGGGTAASGRDADRVRPGE